MRHEVVALQIYTPQLKRDFFFFFFEKKKISLFLKAFQIYWMLDAVTSFVQ